MASSDDTDLLSLTVEDMEWMNIPHEFRRAKLPDIQDESARKLVQRYVLKLNDVVKKGVGLLISGETMAGKTAIAAIVAKAARQRKYTVYFSMIWELRQCILNRVMWDEGATVIDRAREVDFLVLDGLTEEDRDERFFSLSEIEKLVTYRGQRGKITIITTRVPSKEWRDDKKLNRFYEGTSAYLFAIQVQTGGAKKGRRAEMKDLLFGEDE